MSSLLVGPEPVCLVDLETGEIVDRNDRFEEELGPDPGGESKRPSTESEDAHPPGVFEEVVETVRSSGDVRNVEVQLTGVGGEPVDFLLSAAAVRGDEGRTLARVSLRNIAEFKQDRRELEERTRRLEQSNRELEQFAYLASHDLQEPLRMVASYTELLAKRYEDELDDRARKYIDYAVEGAERMKALLNDLLQYSRAGSTDEETVGPVDLEAVLETVVANLRVRIAEQGAQVVWTELPVVQGVEAQLVNVFQNLVDNALKFNDSGTPEVEIGAERKMDRWEISVSDNGIGFDPDNADRIFQVFQRLNGRDDYEGTGIGLAIVEKIVDGHGGELAVESEAGCGTTFTFDLEARG